MTDQTSTSATQDSLWILLRFLLSVRSDEQLKRLLLADLVAKSRSMPADERVKLLSSAAAAFLPDFVYDEIGELALPEYAQQEQLAKSCDTLVVTVKLSELYATQIAFGVDPLVRPDIGPAGIPYWNFRDERGASVAVTLLADDSNVSMANFLSTVFSTIQRPRLVLLIGMAAGVRTKIALGDVVIATHVTDYLHGRATVRGLRRRPRSVSPQPADLRHIERFDPFLGERFPTQWRAILAGLPDSYRRMLPPSHDQTRMPSVKKGGIISGDQLIEDDGLSRWADLRDDNVYAGEMEGYGFATSCIERHLPWMIFRGIADFGTASRERSWQFASSLSAALTARIYLDDAGAHALRKPHDGVHDGANEERRYD